MALLGAWKQPAPLDESPGPVKPPLSCVFILLNHKEVERVRATTTKQRFNLAALSAVLSVLGLATSCDSTGTPGLMSGATGPSTDASGASCSGSNCTKAVSNIVGESCQSKDPHHVCIALTYVSFIDSSGKAISDEAGAIANVKAVNDLWKQCDISFQIEKYQAASAKEAGVVYSPLAYSQIDDIRNAFGNDKSFLLVMSGPWGTVKNAWTNSPGSGPYGAVFESSVTNYPQIIAHELGHYLNLDHIVPEPGEDPANLMNFKIYPAPNMLYSQQCATARASATGYWTKMLR